MRHHHLRGAIGAARRWAGTVRELRARHLVTVAVRGRRTGVEGGAGGQRGVQAAGLERGAEVHVRAEPGRIVVTPASGVRERAMRLFGRSLIRYDRAYARLAK